MKHELNDPTKMMESMAEMMKSAMPSVKTNKNGYEIRTKILDMAMTQNWEDFRAKWGQFETTVEKTSDGQIVTNVTMPEIPGVDQVLETANKFYDFVNNKS